MTITTEAEVRQMRGRVAGLLAKKRDYRREVTDLAARYRYVAFYGCGEVFNSVVDTWSKYIGRKIDYCCDSDSTRWGKYFRGVKCVSPEELTALKDNCAVFVTVGDFRPVFAFLAGRGFPSVNLVYRYDLEASAYLDGRDVDEVTEAICGVYGCLADARSRQVFDAIVTRVLEGGGAAAGLMADVREGSQYFPAGIIGLTGHESFADIGAFDGDTVRDFAARTGGKFDKVYSFELDAVNFKALRENVGRMPERDRVRLFNLGAWDSERDISYSAGKSQSAAGEGEATGHVVTLDEALKGEKVTFIKMDIEGAEPQALRGARNLIREQKPKLAVCIYHDFRHLWEIPLYIKELVPEYKIYLRHHTNLEYETVCYAVP